VIDCFSYSCYFEKVPFSCLLRHLRRFRSLAEQSMSTGLTKMVTRPNGVIKRHYCAMSFAFDTQRCRQRVRSQLKIATTWRSREQRSLLVRWQSTKKKRTSSSKCSRAPRVWSWLMRCVRGLLPRLTLILRTSLDGKSDFQTKLHGDLVKQDKTPVGF
jgi:hypothetical protein